MEECQRRLYAAIAGLECLQITLIKKLAMPPDRCKAAICAASVLLGEAGEWETAKLVFSQADFKTRLKAVDAENVPEAWMARLRHFTSREDFNPHSMRAAAVDAELLCEWCLSVEAVYTAKRAREDASTQAGGGSSMSEADRIAALIAGSKPRLDSSGYGDSLDRGAESGEADDSEAREVENALPEAENVLVAAERGLNTTLRLALSELKSFVKPPAAVSLTLSAVCAAFGQSTDWTTAKKLVNQKDFLSMLLSFDKATMTQRQYKALRGFVQRPEFTPNKIAAVSQACKALCVWCHALVKYYQVLHKIVEPPSPEPQSAPFDDPEEELADMGGPEGGFDDLDEEERRELEKALEKAAKGLNSISKADISELKALVSPPPAVGLTMAAVCAVLGLSTDWATARKLLGSSDFLRSVIGFDKDKMTQRQYKALRSYCKLAEFDPAHIARSSRACQSLCEWCHALVKYYQVLHKIVEPPSPEPQSVPPIEHEQYTGVSGADMSRGPGDSFDGLDEEERRELEKALEKAAKGLNSISKADISELKALVSPPPAVGLTMAAVCAVLGLSTDWATARKLLGSSDLMRVVVGFDKDKMTKRQYKALRSYCKLAEFDPAHIARSSRACQSLCEWCHALVKYYQVLHKIEAEPARPQAQPRPQTSNRKGASRINRGPDEEEASEAVGVSADVAPLLNAAAAALDCISKADIVEIKSMVRPPSLVQHTMQAVCALLGEHDDWPTAQKVMASEGFFERLRTFDKDNVKPSRIAKLRVYTSVPEFTPERAARQSRAAQALCTWCHAMEAYYTVKRSIKQRLVQSPDPTPWMDAAESVDSDEGPSPPRPVSKVIASGRAMSLDERVERLEAALLLKDAQIQMLLVRLDKLENGAPKPSSTRPRSAGFGSGRRGARTGW